MGSHSVFCHFGIFSTGTSVIAIWVYADPASRCKKTGNFDVFGIHKFDEIFHNQVDAIFMKSSMIAKTE